MENGRKRKRSAKPEKPTEKQDLPRADQKDKDKHSATTATDVQISDVPQELAASSIIRLHH